MAESTENIEHRCVLIKANGDLEEVKVILSDKEAVKKLVGGDAEYKGEMEGRQIAILGYCLFGSVSVDRRKRKEWKRTTLDSNYLLRATMFMEQFWLF